MRCMSILLALAISTNACAATADVVEPAAKHDLMPAAITPAQASGSQNGASHNVALPAGSLIAINPVVDLSSKSLKLGDKVKFTTFGDVSQDGVVIIPRGTPGTGLVSFVQGTRKFGKSGKLEVTFTSLDLGGRMIMLTGKHRREGAGNAGAMTGAMLALGVLGGLVVTGHSAVIKQGDTLQARTTEAQTFVQLADGAVVSAPTLPVSPAQ